MTTRRILLPPLNAVRVFEATARHLNYRQAAEELFVTTGAVGQRVRSLESHLGLKLFVRNGGTLALTASGRMFARAARQALLQLSRATEELTTNRRVVTIWAPPTLASRWLVPRLDVFEAGGGDIDLCICADIAKPDLQRMDIDLMIEHTDQPGCGKSLKLFDEEVFPVCSPALLAALPRPLHPRTLLSRPLLHTSLHDFWPAWLGAAGVAADSTRRGSFFNQAMLALQAAADGRGFALACDALVARELEDGTLVQPFPQRLRTGWCYRLATPKDALSVEELEAMRVRLLTA